ncbi:MAG: radical SAM protein [Pseudomonadota bacterium]
MTKILFFLPNSGWDNMKRWLSTPHGITILSALLKKDYSVSLLDANGLNLSEEECKIKLTEFDPDAVLISALSFEYASQYYKAAALVKLIYPKAFTVFGGPFATTMPKEIMKNPHVDYVFQGHAPERITNFLHAIFHQQTEVLQTMAGIGFRNNTGEVIINPVNSYISDVKTMIKPDYSLIDLHPYIASKDNTGSHHLACNVPTATIITSYGCPNKCVFCANPFLNGKRVAFRPVEDVLDEIDFLVQKYAVRQLVFIDDCFLLKRKRVITLFNAFIEREWNLSWKTSAVPAWLLDEDLLRLMKKSGCTQISISVESGVPRVLHNIIGKPLKLETVPEIVRLCKKVGIDLGANFVMGFPGETWEEIRDSIRYAEECDFDVVHFHVATPYPKTKLYDIALEQNLLPPDFDFENIMFHGHAQGYITTDEFSPQELMVLRAYEWDRINFKSKEKTEKVAKMYNMTVENLNKHRKRTRSNLGVLCKND